MKLASNPRTATKAAIKRGSAKARAGMKRLDRQAVAELERIYRTARDDIAAAIQGYADGQGSLRLVVLKDLLRSVDGHLVRLAAARDGLLDGELLAAARLGVGPFLGATAWGANLDEVAGSAVRFVRSFVAGDGLQLSDRLWRIDNGASEAIGGAIKQAVIQGHSAHEAVQDLLSRGAPVPAELMAKLGAAKAERVARLSAAALMTSEAGAYAQAARVFRTEINRAHGEAYMAGGEETDGFAGWRFLLSPNHPQPDICDLHARVNRYGLGPGVYPTREACPWPAHPNTLSFTEIVFDDEISPEDRAGKTDRITWLKGQSPGMQEAVLGARMKRGALDAGLLKENQIVTPWHALRARYERQGVDIGALRPVSLQGGGWRAGESRPVSAGLDVVAHREAVTRAIRAVDQVHGDGRLPLIPVKGSRSADATELGAYRFYADRGRSVDIRISDHGTHKELTAVHEIGHFIDHQGVVPGRFSSLGHPVFSAWREAVDGTKAVQSLRALRDGPAKVGRYQVRKAYVEYLLRREEVWARSYAQYVATRSAAPVLQRQLDDILAQMGAVKYQSQWAPDDFAPVMEAIDAAFRELGWFK